MSKKLMYSLYKDKSCIDTCLFLILALYRYITPVMYTGITGYAPELLVGIGRVATRIFAVALSISVFTSGVALAPMLIVAAITLVAGGLNVVNGITDIQQSISGDQSNYNLFAGVTEVVAIMGSIICGGWLKFNQPRIQAYKNVGSYDFSGTLSKADHMRRPWKTSTMA